MTTTKKYKDSDLVAVVWPRQSQVAVEAGETTWAEASRGDWAMDPKKADRVKALVAVHDDVVVGAWAVSGATHTKRAPVGKSREVNRSRFNIVEEPRLAGLVGGPSPHPRQRNPQTTIELRDLDGGSALLGDAEARQHGVVTLGDFILRVNEEGDADLYVPNGTTVTVRTGV
jgi:hypothetical protein